MRFKRKSIENIKMVRKRTKKCKENPWIGKKTNLVQIYYTFLVQIFEAQKALGQEKYHGKCEPISTVTKFCGAHFVLEFSLFITLAVIGDMCYIFFSLFLLPPIEVFTSEEFIAPQKFLEKMYNTERAHIYDSTRILLFSYLAASERLRESRRSLCSLSLCRHVRSWWIIRWSIHKL